MCDIKKWEVLKQLKTEFLLSIKFAYIFGKTGKEVIFGTKDGSIYVYGINSNGCLGLGHKNEVKEPLKLEELSNKQVIDIAYSTGICSTTVYALTKSYTVYCWGSNKYGQLGNGCQVDCLYPHIIKELSGKCVIDLKCGECYCLALTQTGEVYCWGNNESGSLGIGNKNSPQVTPIKVLDSDAQITAISCGKFHSLALTKSGEVYGWGFNGYGELGIGRINEQLCPTLINICPDIIITKICCGINHSLLLTSSGDIYSFGRNNNGQIGDGTRDNKYKPVMLKTPTKFTDIWCSNISIAVSQDKYCYVWGECDGTLMTTPRETYSETIYDIFLNYTKNRVTYKPIYFDETPKPLMFERFSRAFNSPEFSDFVIKVDNRKIHVQKLYLKTCCKHFEIMFSGNRWRESDNTELEITQYSYPVYYSFLKYLYTDSVDVKLDDTIELLDLAVCYFEEELKQKCIDIVINSVNSDNVCSVYSLSSEYNLQELEDYCCSFILNNIETVSGTESYEKLDKPLLQKLVKYKLK